jgi:hypothetical protein
LSIRLQFRWRRGDVGEEEILSDTFSDTFTVIER